METTYESGTYGAWFLAVATKSTLRDIIAIQREQGKAFGPIAEACRLELAKRGEQA